MENPCRHHDTASAARSSARAPNRPLRLAHLVLAAILLPFLLAACGGSQTPPTRTVAISLSPATLRLAPGATAQLTATVTGTTATGVTWATSGGSVVGTGSTATYTAPTASGTYTVTATSVADPSKSAKATVQVEAGAVGYSGWLRQFGTHLTDGAIGLGLGADDSIAVEGNTVWVLPGATSAGEDDAYVIKFGADGEQEWVSQFGSNKDDVATGMALGPADSVFVTGYTYGSVVAGGAKGLSDGFLVKLAADGTREWASQFGTTGYDWIEDVAVGVDGTAVVVGTTQGLFPGQIRSSTLDGFVAKFGADGGQLWATQFGTSEEVLVEAVAVGSDGSIYVVGRTDGTLPGNTAAGEGDAFLARFGPDGTPAWYKHVATEESDFARAVTLDADGNVIVVGGTEGEFAPRTPEGRYDVFVVKYTADGDELWAQQFGSATLDDPEAAVVGPDGTVYVTGHTTGAMPGNTSSGERDLFVAALGGADGALEWLWQYAPDGSEERAFGVAVASDGDVVVAGTTSGTLEDGYVKGGQPNNLDGFVLKFTP